MLPHSRAELLATSRDGLHRDGSVSTRLKGNMWKGPFHLPRMQWYCWQRLEEGLGVACRAGARETGR
jgi:hypothetical protein